MLSLRLTYASVNVATLALPISQDDRAICLDRSDAVATIFVPVDSEVKSGRSIVVARFGVGMFGCQNVKAELHRLVCLIP